MSHRNGRRANKALPALFKGESLDRSSGGVGAIEDPDSLSGFGCFLQNVKKGGDEGVDSAAQILKINQDDIEMIHHFGRGSPDLPIKAIDWNPENRV